MKKFFVINMLVGLVMLIGMNLGGVDLEKVTNNEAIKSRPSEKQVPGHESKQEWSVDKELLNGIKKSYGELSDEIMLPLLKSRVLWVPAVGMKDSLAEAVDKNPYGEVKTSDVEYGVHMAVIPGADGRELTQAAAYTDDVPLKSIEFLLKREPIEWLKEVLAMPDSEGVVLNPKTRFMKDDYQGVYFTTNKFGVAEVIGMLEVGTLPSGKPFHELANEAFGRGEYYKVLFYWGLSFRIPRSGDDWKAAEISKLRAYYRLGAPSFRERARSELDWMIENHYSAELEPLREEFAAS